MSDFASWIGKSEVTRDVLTPGLLARFRATIDSGQTSDEAPQAIHWCLCPPDAATAQLGADGHPIRTEASFLPPIPMPRRMWASSSVEFLTPLVSGAQVARISTIKSIKEKIGSSGKLAFVEIDHVVESGDMAAIREVQTIVYREAAKGPITPGPMTPGLGGPELKDWDWHREILPAEALLFRYSALTFNTHRIHYDRPYAVDEERYRGLVVHGPLIASLLLDLAARQIDANQLKRFAFRAQSPAFAGEALHLVGRAEGAIVTLAALGSDGLTCMTADASL
jgi:3-methylfumaryl-CoA hydratase